MKEIKAKLIRKLSRTAITGAKAPRVGDPPHRFDATAEQDHGPPPEVIFDRTTGPFSSPRYRLAPGIRTEGS